MNNQDFVHVSLRINHQDHAWLKANASGKKMSLNNYMIDLIRADSLHSMGLPDLTELMMMVKRGNQSCTDLLVYNYVILKLGAAILSFFYTADPSDEGMENAIRFVNRKLDEAREQFL